MPANLKIFLFFILSTNITLAQIIPSFQGVYDKKSSSTSTSNYALDFDGTSDYIILDGSFLSYPWTAEVWYKRKVSKSHQYFLWQSGNSNYWTLRFEQWNNTHKVGITKHKTSDKKWNHTTTIGNWEHLAFVVSSSNTKTVELFVNGESVGFPGTFTAWPKLYWKYIGRNNSKTIDGEIDELRIWDDNRTQAEIKANMFIELEGDEDNLIAYYKMSDGSGTTLTDNASAGNYDGTMTNMTTEDWVTSYAPIATLNSGYKTDIEGLWSESGTSASQDSDGLTMTVSSTLSEENFAIFGNNNTSSTSTSDLPSGVVVRSGRIWQVDESGTVSADVTIDISDATGNSPTVATASNYKLLHRLGTSGNFTVMATGDSVSSGASVDEITFSGVTVNKGFYIIAATESSDL